MLGFTPETKDLCLVVRFWEHLLLEPSDVQSKKLFIDPIMLLMFYYTFGNVRIKLLLEEQVLVGDGCCYAETCDCEK